MDTEKKTRRVAFFQSVKFGHEAVFHQSYDFQDDSYTVDGYVRTSEWVDVPFKPLTNGEMAEAALTAIADERARVVREFKGKLAQLDERAANFRAICAPVSS
jgi:hypothetical protein